MLRAVPTRPRRMSWSMPPSTTQPSWHAAQARTWQHARRSTSLGENSRAGNCCGRSFGLAQPWMPVYRQDCFWPVHGVPHDWPEALMTRILCWRSRCSANHNQHKAVGRQLPLQLLRCQQYNYHSRPLYHIPTSPLVVLQEMLLLRAAGMRGGCVWCKPVPFYKSSLCATCPQTLCAAGSVTSL